jgi:hypothetical protein
VRSHIDDAALLQPETRGASAQFGAEDAPSLS